MSVTSLSTLCVNPGASRRRLTTVKRSDEILVPAPRIPTTDAATERGSIALHTNFDHVQGRNWLRQVGKGGEAEMPRHGSTKMYLIELSRSSQDITSFQGYPFTSGIGAICLSIMQGHLCGKVTKTRDRRYLHVLYSSRSQIPADGRRQKRETGTWKRALPRNFRGSWAAFLAR
jgi:hypothetical protein